MYRVVVNGRTQDVESLEQLAKWRRSGRITSDADVTEVESGRCMALDEVLDVHDDSAGENGQESVDPRDELDAKIKLMTARSPEDFSDAEFKALKTYLRRAKRYYADNVLGWDDYEVFRKLMHKLDSEMVLREIRRKEAAYERKKKKPLPEPREIVPDPHPQNILEILQQRIEEREAAQRQERFPSQPQAEQPYPNDFRSESRSPRESAPVPGTRQSPPVWASPWIIILALAMFPPAGIILLWLSPRKGFMGNIVVRIILTALFAGYYYDDFKEQFLEPEGQQVEFGTGLSEEDGWAILDPGEVFDVNTKIHYLLRDIDCSEDHLYDRIYRDKGAEREKLREESFQWTPAHDLYTHSYTPTQEGTYQLEISCGPEPIVKGTFMVTE